jgi:hypothetical protein
MKETNPAHANLQGGSVKKTLFIVALATVLVFAFAGSALAENHSGQTRTGAAAQANANVTVIDTETVITGGSEANIPNSAANWTTGTVYPGVNSLFGAGSGIYYDWKPTLWGNNSNGNSPHGNYATTTVKCVVCHAVHYAAPGNAPVGGGQSADTLLRMKASDACVYCHATAGYAVNGTPVYNGWGASGPNAINGVSTAGDNNIGHYTGTNCNECHTNVHGANADHSVASLDGYLLRKFALTGVTSLNATSSDMMSAMVDLNNIADAQGFNPLNGYPNYALTASLGDFQNVRSEALREQAVGIFCAECHEGAYATGAAGASTNVYGSGSVQYTGHRIGAAATPNWNSDGTKSSGIFTGTTAWAAADNCKSCHDSNDRFGNPAFPHAWGQDTAGNPTKMWLLSAANAGAIKTAVGASASNNYVSSPVQLQDGVCLKCHVASGDSAGVGITF